MEFRNQQKNLIIEAFDGKHYIHLFDKISGKYIKGFAAHGRGSGEFTHGSHFFLKDDTLCLVNVSNLTINFHPFTKGGYASVPAKVIKIKGCNGCFQILPLENGFISLPTIKWRFALHNSVGEMDNTYTYYPNYENINDDAIIRSTMYAGRQEICIKPDKRKFISLTFMGAIMEIFIINDNKVQLLKTIGFLPPKFIVSDHKKARMDPDSYVGMWSSKATEKYIYTIYSGKKLSEK